MAERAGYELYAKYLATAKRLNLAASGTAGLFGPSPTDLKVLNEEHSPFDGSKLQLPDYEKGEADIIIVTVELAPRGDLKSRKVLARGVIWNDGTGTEHEGNYKIRLSQAHFPGKVWKNGRLEGFPRSRRSIWWLLRDCLNEITGKKPS